MNGAKKTLIVTADDFGIGHEQNLAIDYAMKNNIATQASLVVNSAYTREAVEMARAGGYADKLCLHLTITTGEPLSESIKKAGLYYKDGKFVFRRHQGRRTLLIPQYVHELREEFEAQIEKYLSFGLKLKHIDSHHYIHLTIPCMLALLPLVSKYHVQSVRSYTRAGVRFGHKRPLWQEVYYKAVNVFLRMRFRQFVPYALPAGDVLKQPGIDKARKLELYLHPCVCDGILYDRFSGETPEQDDTLDETAEVLGRFRHQRVCYNDQI